MPAGHLSLWPVKAEVPKCGLACSITSSMSQAPAVPTSGGCGGIDVGQEATGRTDGHHCVRSLGGGQQQQGPHGLTHFCDTRDSSAFMDGQRQKN